MHGELINANRRRNGVRLLFVSIISLLVLIGCELPQKPGDWSWDTHLVVPLGVRTYGMWELADNAQDIREQGSGVGMNDDSSLYFAGYQDLQVSFQDSLRLDPVTFQWINPVTGILVPVDLDQTDNHHLAWLNPDIAALHGTVQDIPPHPLSAASVISLDSRVDSMVVDTGSILISVANALPYAITQVHLGLDNQAGTEYVLIEAENLASGGQLIRRVSMHSFDVQSIAQINLSATGEGGSGILVDSTVGITVNMAVDTVQSMPYYGIIPPQSRTADTSFALTDQRNRLYLGLIDQGYISLTLSNQTQLDDSIWITLPAFTTNAGDTLVSRHFSPANSSLDFIIDLVGYRMRLANTTPQQLEFIVSSLSQETPDHRAFDAVETTSGVVTTMGIAFNYFQGEIHDLLLPIPLQGIPIDRPPQGWESVQPTIVDGYVHVSGGISATASSQIDVRTYLGGGEIASGHFDAPDVFLGTDTTLEYHGLANLMNQYPDSLTSSGNITISGAVALYESETVDMAIELRAPLEFILHPVHAPGDVQRIETNDIEDVQGGSARIRIWNRLPAGGRVYLVAGSDSADVLPNSTADVDTVADMQIPVSSIIDHRATGEAYTEMTFELSEQALQLFHHPPFFTRLNISMPGSGSDTLIADGSDFIRAQVIADVTYRVDTGGRE